MGTFGLHRNSDGHLVDSARDRLQVGKLLYIKPMTRMGRMTFLV